MKKALFVWGVLLLPLCVSAYAQHDVLLVGEGRLARVDAKGEITWEMPWGGIHDIHLLPNGNILTTRNFREVVELDPATKEVVWNYKAWKENGNEGRRIEIHAIQPLPDGKIMIAESGAERIIEIDREGKLLKEIKLKLDTHDAHRNTRLARKLDNGNYLVCHEGDGAVREYDAAGEVVWEYAVPLFDREPAEGHGPESFGNQLYSALRLPNGNTLIGTGNGHSVLEVNKEKEIVWSLHQKDLPNVTFAWVTTLEVLPNGNILVGNCHAEKGQPLLVEIEPKTKQVVWTLDRFDDFGNNVTNSLLMNLAGKTIR